METYIALLLLIVPGFICRKIYENLNSETKELSVFKDTISALIFSIFIIVINYVYLRLIGIVNVDGISDVSRFFGDIRFVVIYGFVTLVNSIFIAYMWNILRPIYLRTINIVRRNNGKSTLLYGDTILDSLNDGKLHLLKIEKGDQILYGYLSKIQITDGELMALSLKDMKDAEELLSRSRIDEVLHTNEKFLSFRKKN